MQKLKTSLLKVFTRFPILREIVILLVFCFLTAVLSWPYVTRLRDVVVDAGDPYLASWVLWWNYHQTFTNPLELFHANTFYPFRYTLAFSEHAYGISLLFFPLFALGFRPLTVHAVAMFFGFATSGYGAFRLARTLTGSNGVAWVSGIIFGFGPFRFHYMSHLIYLFSMWIPLLFEALVLFVRERTVKRTIWFGVAFFMTGLSTISWFILSLFPLALCAIILATRYDLWRERKFWVRGFVAVAIGSLALLPFMLPYYFVRKLYGFHRSIEEVKDGSALPVHWLSVENRNRFWKGLGEGLPRGDRFKLFPGLLPILLSVVGVATLGRQRQSGSISGGRNSHRRWASWLDVVALVLFGIFLVAVGFQNTDRWYGVFRHLTPGRMVALLAIILIVRICLAYPTSFRTGDTSRNLIDTMRCQQLSDVFWVGTVLFTVGFFYSLGWNFVFYRILYEVFFAFQSMRIPARGSMIGYLGLSLLAGVGCRHIATVLTNRGRLRSASLVYLVVCGLLGVEFNSAPLQIMRGAVFPDAVTLKLKGTPMRGGIVILPANAELNHRRMLRAADHGKPLVTGISGFTSPYEDQIEVLTNNGKISDAFLDLLERIPASYLVVETAHLTRERSSDYESMVSRGMETGRLRFINRFDGKTDLYAVVRTEPDAKPEASP